MQLLILLVVSNLTLFEAEQAAEVVRAAARIQILIQSLVQLLMKILVDEVIVTVIATGFDKKNNATKPLYNQLNSNGTSSMKRREQLESIFDDSDDDSGTGFEPSEIEIPTFMHKNF